MEKLANTNGTPADNGVAAVVVLYNSPPACLANVATYRSQVRKLYIIDNSPEPTRWVSDAFADDPSVEYQHFPENAGLATALNTAARQAIRDGFRYLLTMDDDSQAPANLVDTMLTYLATVSPHTVGIVSPRHMLVTASNPSIIDTQPIFVPTTMTSGNLLDLRIYEEVGPFQDALFIDVVDYDYNLRLHTAGYRIVELPGLHLIHRLGTQKRIRFTNLTYVSHSPARNYYLVRNSLAVAIQHRSHHPAYWLTALTTIGIETAKAVLLDDERLLRLRLIYKAITDGLRQRLGKLSVD